MSKLVFSISGKYPTAFLQVHVPRLWMTMLAIWARLPVYQNTKLTCTMPSKRQLFLQHVAQTSRMPLMLEIERAEGLYVYDINGKKYMNQSLAIFELSSDFLRVRGKVYEGFDNVSGRKDVAPRDHSSREASHIVKLGEVYYWFSSAWWDGIPRPRCTQRPED